MALDIFKLLSKIDDFDVNYFKNLSDTEKKEIYFFLIQRWLSGTTDSKQILYLNNFANNKVWTLYNDPNLLYLLLCACSTGKKRYTYPKKKKKEAVTETLSAVISYYDCTLRDAIDYMKILTKENILDICNALALDKDTITKINKELK